MDKRTNKNKQSFNKGDIIIVSYPFSDFKESKIRPAIIISNNQFNKNTEDFILVPLTSILKEKPYSIHLYPEDLVQGILVKPSIIRVDKIFSMKNNMTRLKIGTVSKNILFKIKDMTGDMFK